MTKDSIEQTENKALAAWYKEKLDAVVQEMIKIQAVEGVAVEAAPVWMLPNRILIAKVWQAGRKSNFIWTISGEDMITDHVKGPMATTPRNAAKHFSLKWQMDADRLVNVAKHKAPDEKTRASVDMVAKKLIQQAEFLYSLTERDTGWQ